MKKAVIPVWLTLVFAFIVIGLFLIFFFIFLRGDKTPITVATQSSYTTDSQNLLASYLSSPVIINGETITFADLIKLSYPEMQQQRGRYYSVLVKETEEFLEKNTIIFFKGKKEKLRKFWITFQGKPRTPEEQKHMKSADLLVPRIPSEKIYAPGECIFHVDNICPDKAATYVPVSKDKSIYVAVWSVDI